MISISGIECQKELEELPYFNKETAARLIGKTERNLDAKISRLLKNGYLISLKKGLYTSTPFFQQTDRRRFGELLAGALRFPSYLSLEYVLSLYGLIPEAGVNYTSVTVKSGRSYSNRFGTFLYRHLPQNLFAGSSKIASKAKSLFDFLYLKKVINIRQEIAGGLRINWDNFSKIDFLEFKKYVVLSGSVKMNKILKEIEKIYDN